MDPTPAIDRVRSLDLDFTSFKDDYLLKAPGLSDRDRALLGTEIDLDRLLDSWLEARRVEITGKPRALLQGTGTLSRYQQDVKRLREASSDGDAFRQFSMLTTTEEMSVDTQYRAKAALNREASWILLEQLPGLLHAVARHSNVDNEGMRTLQEWVNEAYQDGFLPPEGAKKTLDFFLRAARASRHFHDFPPDPHGLRTRAELAERPNKGRSRGSKNLDQQDRLASDLEGLEPTKQQRRDPRSKKGTVTKLNQYAKRRGPGFDWRGEIWRQIEAAPKLQEDRKALFAVAMTTGCRPVDLLNGVDVYRLKPSPEDNYYRLLIRIGGSKMSTSDFLDEGIEDPFFRRTAADEAELAELREEESVRYYHEKGQPFRYLEVECRTPEAVWLAQYVHGSGVEAALRTETNYELEEMDGSTGERDYTQLVQRGMQLSLVHRFLDEDKAEAMPEAERRRYAVKSFSKTLAYYSKKALPTFREKITTYCFRHAFAQDLKVASREEWAGSSAAALGHASNTTQSQYGGQKKPQAHITRGGQVIRMITRHPVRERKQQADWTTKRTTGPSI